MNFPNKFLNKPINNLKIANKMMFIYIVGGFIPLLLLSIYLIGYTRSILIDQATKEALNNATRIEERLQGVFKKSVDISDGIYLDQDLKNIIKTNYTSQIEIIEDLDNYKQMDDYLRLYPEIDSIRIYVNNDTLLNDAQIVPSTESHRGSFWYKRALEEDGKIAYVYRYDEFKGNYYLSLVRLIKDNTYGDYGVLVVNISNRTFVNLLSSEPYDVIGIIDDSRVFLSSDYNYYGLTIDDHDDLITLNSLDDVINDVDLYSNNHKVIVNSFTTHFSGNKIKLVTMIPTNQFLGYANRSISNSILLIAVSVFIAILLVYLLTKRLSGRINLFRDHLHRVATGDFEVDYQEVSSDEIGLLFTDLNVMRKSIKNLVQEVYESGLQKEKLTTRQREVEFKMLTSQIDPHFLYNTLETIRMEAIINNQQPIADLVKKLAYIMRRKLSVYNEEVSLDSELELLIYYIEIQQYRFGDRISYQVIKNCDTEGLKILPLLLQPVVENAIIHGLENKVGKSEISVEINKSDDFLEITIQDNGIGISNSKMERIKERLDADVLSASESVGLINVHQRIKVFYQWPYRLEMSSQENIGTKMKYYLPISGAVEGGTNV